MNQQCMPPSRLPDFIIGGAPKCGTTSLHFILKQNPSIGLPDEEIHYFDADDPVSHPDFLHVEKSKLEWFDARPSDDRNLKWYADRFAPFADKPLVGEDSTTYLFSAVAPGRIHALIPDVRLIFLLRDPVKRAYSQYWHLICSGRLTCSFEQALSRHTSILLGSTYALHLAQYFKAFGRDAVNVSFFEDFVTDKQSFLDRITVHIGAPQMPLDDVQTWFNRTAYPSHPKGQRLLNQVGARFVAGRYRNHMSQHSGWRTRFRNKMHYRWFHYINPILLNADTPPAMLAETRAYLEQHLSERNRGLSDLLERDLSQIWPWFEG